MLSRQLSIGCVRRRRSTPAGMLRSVVRTAPVAAGSNLPTPRCRHRRRRSAGDHPGVVGARLAGRRRPARAGRVGLDLQRRCEVDGVVVAALRPRLRCRAGRRDAGTSRSGVAGAGGRSAPGLWWGCQPIWATCCRTWPRTSPPASAGSPMCVSAPPAPAGPRVGAGPLWSPDCSWCSGLPARPCGGRGWGWPPRSPSRSWRLSSNVVGHPPKRPSTRRWSWRGSGSGLLAASPSYPLTPAPTPHLPRFVEAADLTSALGSAMLTVMSTSRSAVSRFVRNP